MEYKVVSNKYRTLHSGTQELEKEIAKLISNGWQPQGGIAITSHPDFSFTLAQAMVKYPDYTKQNIN